MKHPLTFLIPLLLASFTAQPAAANAAAQSNIIFILADDLGETRNLAAAMPEKVAGMKMLLEKLIASGRSTPGVKQTNDVEVERYPRQVAPKGKAKAR